MKGSNQNVRARCCRHLKASLSVPTASVIVPGSSVRTAFPEGGTGYHRQPPENHGAVLIVGLIILLVMVVLGISGICTSVLQERMAGHTKDTNSSFQAAEAGMQAALTYLASLRMAPVLKRKGAVIAWSGNPIWSACEVQDADPGGGTDFDPCATLNNVIADWSIYPDAPVTTLGGQAMNSLSGAALPTVSLDNQPHFVIESRYVPPLDFEEAARRKGFHYYTVAAVGLDHSTNARTILQTTITKQFY
jgi:type IV pilus assembly protein PilX